MGSEWVVRRVQDFQSLNFFFTDTATTEIYTLSLHDALTIEQLDAALRNYPYDTPKIEERQHPTLDRKSTRLNSSHRQISYAVVFLKKKKEDGADARVETAEVAGGDERSKDVVL